MIANPTGFWLILSVLPIVLIGLISFKRGRKDLKKVNGIWSGLKIYDVYTVKWFFSILSLCGFIVFISLSLSGIHGQDFEVKEEPSDRDMVFLLDVSRSMLAQDVSPNRLEKSLDIIQGIIEGYKGSGRFGFVVFKGEGVVMIPLTEDKESLMLFLKTVNTGLLTSPGSDLESGISTSLASFIDNKESRKLIFAFSDGEFLSGDHLKAAKKARSMGVRICTIGTGSSLDVSIPLGDDKFVENLNGEIVKTRLNVKVLKEVSKVSQGDYFSTEDSFLLGKLLKIIEGNLGGIIVEPLDLYQRYIIFALVFLFLYLGIRVWKWKKYF